VPGADGVLDADAPDESDGVAELVGDAARLAVDDAVGETVPLAVGVALPVGLPELVADAVGGAEGSGEGEFDGVAAALGVPLADAPTDRVLLGVADAVVERLCVLDGESLPLGVALDVGAAVPVPEPVLDGVGVAVAPRSPSTIASRRRCPCRSPMHHSSPTLSACASASARGTPSACRSACHSRRRCSSPTPCQRV